MRHRVGLGLMSSWTPLWLDPSIDLSGLSEHQWVSNAGFLVALDFCLDLGCPTASVLFDAQRRLAPTLRKLQKVQSNFYSHAHNHAWVVGRGHSKWALIYAGSTPFSAGSQYLSLATIDSPEGVWISIMINRSWVGERGS